jgi:hypothetical protein
MHECGLFYSRMSRSFDHFDNRSSFGIDPSDGRSGAKRAKQVPVASTLSFFRKFLIDPLAISPPTGCPPEQFCVRAHPVLIQARSIGSWLVSIVAG